MSYQLALCSRVVRTGDLASVLNFGITLDDFTLLEAKNFWSLILSYYTQQESCGSVVTEGMLQKWFKGLILQDDMPSLTVETLCYNVRRERIIIEGNSAIVRFSEEVSIPTCNPADSLATLNRHVSDLIALGTTANTDITLKTGLDNVLRKLSLAKQGVNHAIMKWPWDVLNRATFGLQPDDYIVFYGRPKSMKTWVLVYLIAEAFEHAKKILVYTKEMTPDNVYMRTLACIAKLVYDDLREASSALGKPLSEVDEEKLRAIQNIIMSDPEWGNRLIVLSGRDVPPGGDTVAWLNSKIEQYHPDVMFVDGLYLLSDQRKSTADHTRVMNISRDLRQMVLSTQVPIIATMQANRKAAGHSDANLDEIAYSDALAQDATIAARVINDKTTPTISIVIGGSREFKLHGFRINAIPARDFSFHSELTEKDALKAKEADAPEKEVKKETVRTNGKKSHKADQKAAEKATDTDVSAALRGIHDIQ